MTVPLAGTEMLTGPAPVIPAFSPKKDNAALPADPVEVIMNALWGASAAVDAAAVLTIL
jgi:hypothetical protein